MDVFLKLRGGQSFTKLDLKSAYQQLPLDPESQQFVTINTHRGLYRYRRLPFGKQAPRPENLTQLRAFFGMIKLLSRQVYPKPELYPPTTQSASPR